MNRKPTYEELEQKVRELEGSLASLRNKTETFRKILDCSPSVICAKDLDGRYTSINKQFENLSGLKSEDVLGKTDFELFPLSIARDSAESDKRVIETGASLEMKGSGPVHGRLSGFTTTKYPLMTEDGDIYGICGISTDITARARAEEALRSREAFLDRVIDQSPFAIWISDAEGVLQHANPTLKKFLNLTDEQLVGKYNVLKDPLVEKQGLTPLVRTVFEEGKTISFKCDWDGNDIPNMDLKGSNSVSIEAAMFPVFNMEGKLTNVVLNWIDITDRKRAEDALRESDAHLRTLIETIPDLIWLKDPDGIYITCNPKFERFFGAKRSEIRGKTDHDFVDKELADFFREKDRAAMAAGKPSVNEEEVTYADDGHRELLETIKTPMYDSKGKLVGVLGVARDITDRKRAEEALRASEREYRSTLDNLLTGVVVHAPDKRVLLGNPEAGNILGLTPGQMAGKEVFDPDWHFVREDLSVMDIEDHPVNRVFLTGEPLYDYVAGVERPDRDCITWVSFNAIPVFSDDGGIEKVVVSFVDITGRRKAEEALRESEARLVRSRKMESLGLLAGGVAHDLNNVLSGIVSYPELLLMDLPEDSKFRKPVETMRKTGHKAVAIVQDLLTVARGVATTMEPLNLNTIVEDYLLSPEFIRLKQYHPAVEIKTELDADLLNLNGSYTHILKIVMNLVSNAAEAMESGGNVMISTMNRYVDRPLKVYDDVNMGEYVVLAVSDEGPGISPDDLERIFEPFYTKKVMGRSGTGLGLAVVWNVVRDHNGYIDVMIDSDGARFELYFPITREERGGKDPSTPVEEYKGDGETILVVDDEEIQREISCNMLNALGYAAKAVSSGEEAVEYLEENSVDLLLLDMIMDPGINGRETYERIIKNHPGQKAVIVSGFAETEDVREAGKSGAGRFVKKPLTLKRLGMAVRDELGK